MSDAVPRSEPRMTRSRAKALGGTTPVKTSIFSDIKRGATALLSGKSKGKKDTAASPDVAATLFSKAAPQEEESVKEYAARDQDQSVSPFPQQYVAQEQVACTKPEVTCMQPEVIGAQPEATCIQPEVQPEPVPAATLLPEAPTAAPPTPVPSSPAPAAVAAGFDAMAISPVILAMPDAPPSPAPQAFGTPVDMDMMAASPMQLNSPAVMPHMSPALEDRRTPQEPIAEDPVTEMLRPEEAVSEAMTPACTAMSAEAPASPASPAAGLVGAAPVLVTTTPKGPRATLKTPRSAGVQGAAARTAPKVPLSTLKPPSGATRTPAAAQVPVAVTAERAVQPPAVISADKMELGVQAVTPTSRAAVSCAKPAAQRTVKRVSIATPQTSQAGPTSARPIVRTPYPRSSSKTPVAFAAADMTPNRVDGNAAAQSKPAATPAAAVAVAAEVVAAILPAEPAEVGFEQQECANEADDSTRLVNATMQLAAALPPSYRTTCEEVLSAEPSAVLAACHGIEDSGMDVDSVEAATFTLAPSAMPQDSGTPELKPLGRSAAADTPAVTLATPMSTKLHQVAKTASKATPNASTTPKLTIPVSSGFNFMASTKSFEQKARPLQMIAVGTADISSKAPAAAKPRVKSEIMGVRGDDRSVKQLKREIKAAMDAKAKQNQSIKGLDSDDEMGEAPYSAVDEAMLVDAMSGKVQISAPRVVLRGVPAPQGQHIRFQEDGKAVPSPSNGRVQLKGVPAATGSHKRFH